LFECVADWTWVGAVARLVVAALWVVSAPPVCESRHARLDVGRVFVV
jgi:hypothetical protein